MDGHVCNQLTWGITTKILVETVEQAVIAVLIKVW